MQQRCSAASLIEKLTLSGEHRLIEVVVVLGERGVELILGRGLQMAVKLVP